MIFCPCDKVCNDKKVTRKAHGFYDLNFHVQSGFVDFLLVRGKWVFFSDLLNAFLKALTCSFLKKRVQVFSIWNWENREIIIAKF